MNAASVSFILATDTAYSIHGGGVFHGLLTQPLLIVLMDYTLFYHISFSRSAINQDPI